MLRDKLKVLNHGFHCRIIAAAFFQLQSETFRNGACHHARWVKTLADFKNGFDIGRICAKCGRNFFKVCAQIAGIISFVAQARRTQAVSRRQRGEVQLGMQVFVQGNI